MITRRAVALAVMTALVNGGFAAADAAPPPHQDAVPAKASIENVRTVVRGGTVRVSYDLVSPDPNANFEVMLEVKNTAGVIVNATALSGDIGRVVSAGNAKSIAWDASKDTQSLQLDQFSFKVLIKPEPSSSSQSRPPEPATRPDPPIQPRSGSSSESAPPPATSSNPTNQPARPGATQRTAGSGKATQWAGLAAVGGGIILGVVGTRACQYPYPDGSCGGKTTNNALIGAGAGIAATGLVMFILGRHQSGRVPTVALGPDGIVVYRTIEF